MPSSNTVLVSSPRKVSEEANLKEEREKVWSQSGSVNHVCLAPLLRACVEAEQHEKKRVAEQKLLILWLLGNWKTGQQEYARTRSA